MKKPPPGIVPGQSIAEPGGMNRALVRASISEVREKMDAAKGVQRKPPPPAQTHAEEFYYVKQKGARTPMVVVLNSREVLQGVIEWYDRRCIKLNRTGQPNLLIMKNAIRYLYKQSSGALSKADAAGSHPRPGYSTGAGTIAKR